MSPTLRAFFYPLIVFTCLVFGSVESLHAQAFSLAKSSAKIVANPFADFRLVDFAISSDDPTFETKALTISNNSGGWLTAFVPDTSRAIRVYVRYGNGKDASAKITIRSATQTTTLSIERICIADARTPKAILSSDKTRIYALYQDSVLMIDARTQDVLASARLALPSGFKFSIDSGRAIYLSNDQRELRIFLSDCPLVFRLSAIDLSSLRSITLPRPKPAPLHRFFGREKAGNLYFVRYGNQLMAGDSVFSDHVQHYESAIEVVSASTGALLQTYSLPASDQIITIADLAPHPDRPEIWILERRRDSSIRASVWSRRLALDEAGRVQGTLGEPLHLEAMDNRTFRDPWTDGATRTLLRPGSSQAIAGPVVLDAVAEPPVILHTLATAATLLSRGNIAAAPEGIFRLDTRESLPATLWEKPAPLRELSIVGLSDDGRDVLGLPSDARFPLPILYSLPAALAAHESAQARTPVNGSMVGSPEALSWYSLPGADHYRVYLSTRAADLSGSDLSDAFVFAEPAQASLALANSLAPGATYFWRVDAIYDDRVVAGTVQSFSISHARVETQPLEVAVVLGARRRDFSFPIATTTADTAWEIVSEVPWITVRTGSGVGPGNAELSVDALSLSANETTARVGLKTADGTVPVVIKFIAGGTLMRTATTRPDWARLLVVGSSVSVGGKSETLLFTMDTESGEILRCTSVPVITLPIDSKQSPFCASATGPLYVFASNNRFGEFDPETLELKRVVSPPVLSGRPPPVKTVRPDGQGRIWILDRDNVLTRLNSAGDAYDLVLRPAAHHTYLSEDGTSLYTFTVIHDGSSSKNPATFTLRRYDLSDDSLDLMIEKTYSSPQQILYSDAPAQGLNPTRFSFQGVIYDDTLNPVATMEGVNLSITNDGTCALSTALLHTDDDYSSTYLLPRDYSTQGIQIYEPVARAIASNQYYGFKLTPLVDLPEVTPLSLHATKIEDTIATLAWDRPPVIGTRTEYDLYYQVAYRPAGSSLPWTLLTRSYQDLGVSGLSPRTNYEVRARLLSSGAATSGWSEPIAITTPMARPTVVSWPEPVLVDEQVNVSLPLSASGEDAAWTVADLPPGLTFNTDTRTIEGTGDTPGLYNVRVTVTNAGGATSQSFALNIVANGVHQSFSRYSGLQKLTQDALVGDWRATRSGDTITGVIRTFVGSGSFKVKLAPVDGNYLRKRSFKVVIAGTKVDGFLSWNVITDRIGLSLNFADRYTSESLPETGKGIANDRTHPHPFANRFTALAIQGPDQPSSNHAPEGAGLILVDLAENGVVAITAETSLGQRFTASTSISRDKVIPLFSPNRPYQLWGLLHIDHGSTPTGPRVSGSINWINYTNRQASSYPDGFEQQLLIIGAPLPATGENRPPLYPLANDTGQADFSLSGGGLVRFTKPIIQSLSLAPSGLIAPKPGTPANPNRVTVKLDPKTGIVTGSAAILNATGTKVTRTQPFRGMFIKDPLGDGEDVIGGYFLLPDAAKLLQSGRLEISEPESPE